MREEEEMSYGEDLLQDVEPKKKKISAPLIFEGIGAVISLIILIVSLMRGFGLTLYLSAMSLIGFIVLILVQLDIIKIKEQTWIKKLLWSCNGFFLVFAIIWFPVSNREYQENMRHLRMQKKAKEYYAQKSDNDSSKDDTQKTDTNRQEEQKAEETQTDEELPIEEETPVVEEEPPVVKEEPPVVEEEPEEVVKSPHKTKSFKTLKMEQAEFSIQDYWNKKKSTSATYIAECEKGDKTVTLKIEQSYDYFDEVTYSILKKETENGSMAKSFSSWFDECSEISYEKYDNGSIEGYIYKCTYTDDGIDGYSECLCFPSVDDNRWFYVSIRIPNDCDYEYIADYRILLDKIVLNVPEKQEEKKDDSSSSTGNGQVSASFKKAMDAYEAVMDEYIAFMKKYMNSGYDFGMLMDYMSYLEKMEKAEEELNKIDYDNLSYAEQLYYLEVVNRVSLKLVNVL